MKKNSFIAVVLIGFSVFFSAANGADQSSASDSRPWLRTPDIYPDPGERYAEKNRFYQGIPSIAVAPGGRLWATWYSGGEGEEAENYVMISTSGDGGITWSDKLAVDPDGNGPVRAFDPQIWIDPNGTLWAFWMQTIRHDGTVAGVWAVTTDQPDEENPVWSAPVRLTDGVMIGKPLFLSTGEWVLPASTWKRTDNSARMVTSRDQGKTWELRGAANVPVQHRRYDEHMIVERKDGSLWMLIRTKYGIGESVSKDCGKSWSPVIPSKITHCSSRFFITRLQSGRLLLVKNGPIGQDVGRTRMTAFLSDDEGMSWYGGLLLDDRSMVSYPDGMQAADGTIYVIYDRSRDKEMEILMTAFTEEDVAAGKAVSEKIRFKQLVSKGRGYNPKFEIPPVAGFIPGAAAELETSGNAAVKPIEKGAALYTDRDFTWLEIPAEMKEKRYLLTSVNGEEVTVKKAGMVYVATPLYVRNRSSLQWDLLEQKFALSDLKEFMLFAPRGGDNEGTLCSVFQKRAEAGEKIKIGYWGLLIY